MLPLLLLAAAAVAQFDCSAIPCSSDVAGTCDPAAYTIKASDLAACFPDVRACLATLDLVKGAWHLHQEMKTLQSDLGKAPPLSFMSRIVGADEGSDVGAKVIDLFYSRCYNVVGGVIPKNTRHHILPTEVGLKEDFYPLSDR